MRGLAGKPARAAGVWLTSAGRVVSLKLEQSYHFSSEPSRPALGAKVSGGACSRVDRLAARRLAITKPIGRRKLADRVKRADAL